MIISLLELFWTPTQKGFAVMMLDDGECSTSLLGFNIMNFGRYTIIFIDFLFFQFFRHQFKKWRASR